MFSCFLLFHNWGKWKLEEVVYTSYFLGDGEELVNIRECAYCGKTQIKHL